MICANLNCKSKDIQITDLIIEEQPCKKVNCNKCGYEFIVSIV